MNRAIEALPAGVAGKPVAGLRVLPGWIDFNDHMNVAYYVLAFDQAIDALWLEFGMTENYRAETGNSTFAAECHIRYLRELKVDDPVLITAEVIAFDEKRIHQFQRMYHQAEGFLAATCEWMNLHIDSSGPRVTPWPAEVHARIAEFARQAAMGERPEGLGSVIGLRRQS